MRQFIKPQALPPSTSYKSPTQQKHCITKIEIKVQTMTKSVFPWLHQCTRAQI